MLTLYMHPISTVSRPVSLFIAEKELPVTEKVLDLMAGEHKGAGYLAINPNGQVPSLAEGDFRMAESSAILKYLASRFDCPEYPKDLKERAKVDEAMDWFNTNLYRDFGYGLLYPQIFPHHKRPSEEFHSGVVAWGKQKTQAALRILDVNMLGANDYVTNDRISIADYFGVGLLTAGETIGCTYGDYPNVCRWIGSMKQLKSWNRVNEVFNGFAASMKGKDFERV
ncbi:MAG TPA: glutathione S-transferase family protein [Vitreimonas sp.]|nr:glutathione S-transferase family protein [Vitreimonas sp.]